MDQINQTGGNGKINSADIYYTTDLFKSLWPKLLNTIAIEAVAEGSMKPKGQFISDNLIRIFLTEAEQGQEFPSHNFRG